MTQCCQKVPIDWLIRDIITYNDPNVDKELQISNRFKYSQIVFIYMKIIYIWYIFLILISYVIWQYTCRYTSHTYYSTIGTQNGEALRTHASIHDNLPLPRGWGWRGKRARSLCKLWPRFQFLSSVPRTKLRAFEKLSSLKKKSKKTATLCKSEIFLLLKTFQWHIIARFRTSLESTYVKPMYKSFVKN